jgi:hypothetical protein
VARHGCYSRAAPLKSFTLQQTRLEIDCPLHLCASQLVPRSDKLSGVDRNHGAGLVPGTSRLVSQFSLRVRQSCQDSRRENIIPDLWSCSSSAIDGWGGGLAQQRLAYTVEQANWNVPPLFTQLHGSRFTIHDLRFYTLCCYYFLIQYFPLCTALSNYVVCVPIILIAHRKLTLSYPSSVLNEFPSCALEGSRAHCDGQLSRSHYKAHRLGFGYWSNRRHD